MLRKIFALIVIVILPILTREGPGVRAQTAPMAPAAPPPASSGLAVGVPKLPPIATPRNQQIIPVPEQPAPDLVAPSSQTAPFEHGASVLSLPKTFADQISPTQQVPPESIISQSFLRSRDDTVRGLSLKQAIYIGLINNPNITVAELDPLASEEAVKVANATFDPALTAEGDIMKSVVPVTSPFQVVGSRAFTNKLYDWDFGLNKVSALTNGTFGITFDNERAFSNSTFASINPSYTPQLALSISTAAAQLWLELCHDQRADRRVFAEGIAVEHGTDRPGFRAADRHRLLERGGLRRKPAGGRVCAQAEQRPGAPEPDLVAGRNAGAHRSAGGAVR